MFPQFLVFGVQTLRDACVGLRMQQWELWTYSSAIDLSAHRGTTLCTCMSPPGYQNPRVTKTTETH